MSGIYRRYFRVDSGPLIDAIKEISDRQDIAAAQIMEFAKKLGAKDVRVYESGSIAGFIFDSPPDPASWKKSKVGGFYPKQNSSWGRAVVKEIKNLPKYTSHSEALKVIGLSTNHPVLIGNERGYFNSIQGSKDVVFVSIPWRDIDPKEMEDYLNDDSRFSVSMEHLKWKPTAEMKEIKEWEMLKELEDME